MPCIWTLFCSPSSRASGRAYFSISGLCFVFIRVEAVLARSITHACSEYSSIDHNNLWGSHLKAQIAHHFEIPFLLRRLIRDDTCFSENTSRLIYAPFLWRSEIASIDLKVNPLLLSRPTRSSRMFTPFSRERRFLLILKRFCFRWQNMISVPERVWRWRIQEGGKGTKSGYSWSEFL